MSETLDAYEKFKIKSYSLWDLYIHKEQYPYVGRCYAAAKRPEAENATQMTHDEAIELFTVIVPEWFKTVKELYQADWPNIAILGNDWRHLHAHFIPRYNTPRKVHGVDFVDPQPTKNYAPYPRQRLSAETLEKIRDDLILYI